MQKLCLLLLLWGSHPLFCQTLTLNLAGPTSFKASGSVVMNLTLSGASGQNISGIQFAIPAPGGVATVTAGPASTAASKTVSCAQSMTAPNPLTCILIGLNNTAYADGIVAVVSVALPNPLVQGITWTMPVVVASTTGSAVTTTSSAPVNPCNITGSGTITANDVSASIASALTQNACVDLTGDGTCNIFDVIRVVLALQPNGTCKVGP